MSEIKHAPLWYPPEFPVQGRLPSREAHVYQNMQRQRQQERDYHDEMSMAAGRRVTPPCCKTLHITLCFDGTGNNLNNDFLVDVPRHPTNIARMFRVSIGDGYAGGVVEGGIAAGLTDLPGAGDGQYFKYYMPGVGTPFPEVGDLDYSAFGLALAGAGEDRINWGLMMIIDALRLALKLPRQDDTQLLAGVKAMGTVPGLEWATGRANRWAGFYAQLAPLLAPLRIAMTQLPGQSRLLGLNLYIYGFSRGAAAARAFVSWLNELLIAEPVPSLKVLDSGLPVSVQYLGLLDSVASVGIAAVIPGADGHMSWADGNQQLPENGLVKRCLHLVASHEQRLCFPLESIRRENGDYPANSQEVLHPGVHSDVGGGYPPGEQGKGVGENDGLLLSQITLNDLYADAFTHGAPLKVPTRSSPKELSHERWRVMEADVERSFVTAPTLRNRFNAWREVTLGLMPSTRARPPELAVFYEPIQASATVDHALRDQMAWMTAWRIDRYAFASLLQTAFYKEASDTQANPAERERARQKRDGLQKDIETARSTQRVRERIGQQPKPLPPGLKDFDPDMAQTQLREAAEEFGKDYREGLHDTVVVQVSRYSKIAGAAGALWTADVRAQRERMKKAGHDQVATLFPPPVFEQNHVTEQRRGNVDESRNATRPEGLLRALFDDQVHDSRAWFLYSAGREPFGSYLAERKIFFGDATQRDLALYDRNNMPIVANAQGLPAAHPARAPHPPFMDAEQLAQAQKDIDALWAAYDAKVSGVNDAQA